MTKIKKAFYLTDAEYADLRQVLEIIRSDKTNIQFKSTLEDDNTLVVLKRPVSVEDLTL